MVQAHAMMHGMSPRPTLDADLLLNILTYDRIATQMRTYIGGLGFQLEENTMTGYATRFVTKTGDKIDLLVTDYLYGKAKRENARLAGRPLCGMPAGGQAIKRSERIAFDYADEHLTIRIPDLLGSVMLKSAAWDVDRTIARNRHLRDAAALLSMIDDPEQQIGRLHSSNDRRRILILHENLTEDADAWDDIDTERKQNGLDVLDQLTEWAEQD